MVENGVWNLLTIYLPGNSWLHRLPAGLKLLGLAVFSTAIYQVTDLTLLAGLTLAVMMMFFSFGWSGWRYMAVIRPLVPLFALLFGLQWWSISLPAAFVLLCRMVMLIWMAHMLTLTTPMQQMMDAITPVLSPLKLIGFKPERLAFAVVLLIRFVPVLMALVSQLQDAWQARAGGRNRWRLVVPVLINAIRMSDQVADSLSARGGISPVYRVEKVK